MISKETKDKIKSIVKRIVNFEDTIVFKTSSEENIKRIVDIIRYDYVVTFHLGDIDYFYNQNDGTVTLKPNYLFEKQEYDLLMQKVLNRLTVIKGELSKKNSEIEKELFIHDFLCKSVVYHDEGKASHSIVGPLLFQKGVCEGISKTAHALFKLAGIESAVICGTSVDEHNCKTPHSWNAAKIDGVWYLLDITFDNNLSDADFVRYDYFNVSAKELNESHIPCEFHRTIFDSCFIDSTYFNTIGAEFPDINSALKYIKKSVRKKMNKIYLKVRDLKEEISNAGVTDYVLRMNGVNKIVCSVNEKMKILLLKIEYSKLITVMNFYTI